MLPANDPMNNCRYKHSHDNGEIINRANQQILSYGLSVTNPVIGETKSTRQGAGKNRTRKNYKGGHPNPDPNSVNAAASAAYAKYGGKRKKRTRKRRRRKKRKTRRKKY